MEFCKCRRPNGRLEARKMGRFGIETTCGEAWRLSTRHSCKCQIMNPRGCTHDIQWQRQDADADPWHDNESSFLVNRGWLILPRSWLPHGLSLPSFLKSNDMLSLYLRVPSLLGTINPGPSSTLCLQLSLLQFHNHHPNPSCSSFLS